MAHIAILVVEDDAADLRVIDDTVVRYQKEHQREIHHTVCRSLEEAREKLSPSYDGAIVDLKLAGKSGAGNDVASELRKFYRVPVAVFTGTPGDADPNIPYVGIYKKGETKYDEIFDRLFAIQGTGLTRIMGGRGVIEEVMGEVFWKDVMPDMSTWIGYATKGKDTEIPLLRLVIGHLSQLLREGAQTLPAEVYVRALETKYPSNGAIVERKSDGALAIVMTPSCDLAIRANGECKTDRICVCWIERVEAVAAVAHASGGKGAVDKLYKNAFAPYYHFLPNSGAFGGGVINFRAIATFALEEFEAAFAKPLRQVSIYFVKDIIARFASFYARQGQPDLDLE